MIQSDHDPVSDNPREAAVVRRAEHIAKLFDKQFRLPGTSIRFGYDSIIGLIPGIGDTLSAIVSLYPIFEAVRLRIGVWPIFKMLLNVGVDWLVGLIPVLDIFFDVVFKANVKNANILTKALERRKSKDTDQ
jgi:hypothetical protein